LSDAIEKRIGDIVPSDVMVHAEPRAPQGEHLFEAIRAAAQSLGLAVHDLTAVQHAGQLFIELHLEVDEKLSLREAHRQASDLEEKSVSCVTARWKSIFTSSAGPPHRHA